MILLNPGPVNLTSGVRQALAGPDICHREPEFTALQDAIRQRLLEVYGLPAAQWAAVLLAGSGTAAVEAMLSSLVPQQGRLLIVNNGVYGKRMARMAAIHDINHHTLNYDWLQAPDLAEVERTLVQEPGISHLAVVHHETTTGRLNDLASLGALCRARGVRLLVDAVSSFGAEELDFANWDISACAATANKCLHGAPGISFVLVRRDQLTTGAKRTLYLDLATYCEEQDNHSTPFTQPVQLFYALDTALAELDHQGGWPRRRKQYQELAHLVREGLTALGIKPVLPEEETSAVLSAYYLPKNIPYEYLHEELKTRGYVIYAGQGRLSSSLFRISTMGAITRRDIEDFLIACREIVSK